MRSKIQNGGAHYLFVNNSHKRLSHPVESQTGVNNKLLKKLINDEDNNMVSYIFSFNGREDWLKGAFRFIDSFIHLF